VGSSERILGAGSSDSFGRAQIKLEDQFVQVIGDVAYELGVERGQYTLAGKPVAADYRVTNIYRRESGAWKIVHHHADIQK
jgi:ketosteroid isomerase-like protein